MYQSVANAFVPFSAPLEAIIRWPYVDRDNWVTTAMGYKVDEGAGEPPASFLALPWKHTDNSPVPTDEAIAGWHAVKNSGLQGVGGGSQQFADLTDLRLDDAAIAEISASKLSSNEGYLAGDFVNYVDYPADWQLLLNSMAWALGPKFAGEFPKFHAAIDAVAPDFDAVVLQCWMKDSSAGVPQTRAELDQWVAGGGPEPDLNSGLRPRNLANVQLAKNGAAALQDGGALDVLWWPGTTRAGAGQGGGGGGASPGSLANRVSVSGGGLLTAVGIVGLVAAGIAGYTALTEPAPHTHRRPA